MSDLMTEPMAKWQRARELAVELQVLCRDWSTTQQVELGHELEDGGWHVWSALPLPEPPPLVFGIRFGEVLHNLRSSLDYVVHGLVEAAGNPPSDKNQFPVSTKLAAWQTARGKDLRGVPGAAVDLIERWQPFVRSPGSEEADDLARLHRLSVIDKHRVIHPSVAAINRGRLRYSMSSDVARPRVLQQIGRPDSEVLFLDEPQWLLRMKVGDAAAEDVPDLSAQLDVTVDHINVAVGFREGGAGSFSVPADRLGGLVAVVRTVLDDLATVA